MKRKHPDSLLHMMAHVLKKHRHTIDRMVHEYGVYPGQPPLLLRLSEEDGLSQSELAARIHNKPATLTVMVDRMEKAGFVVRKPDAHDQRVTRVYLTDKGREVTAVVKEAIKVADDQCLENVLPEEKLLLRRLLIQMLDNLEQSDDS